MNKRIWGVIIIILGLLILLAVVYFVFFYKIPRAPEPSSGQPGVFGEPAALEPAAAVNQPAASEPAAALKAEVKADDLARLAAAFAERFGSFSNQSDYGNLRDLEIFMTESMQTRTREYINEARLKKADTSIYYGIVTKSVLTEIKLFDADLGQAEVLVKTQRREAAGITGNSSTFYQDITIKYSREDGVWRVDGAYWQEK